MLFTSPCFCSSCWSLTLDMRQGPSKQCLHKHVWTIERDDYRSGTANVYFSSHVEVWVLRQVFNQLLFHFYSFLCKTLSNTNEVWLDIPKEKKETEPRLIHLFHAASDSFTFIFVCLRPIRPIHTCQDVIHSFIGARCFV